MQHDALAATACATAALLLLFRRRRHLQPPGVTQGQGAQAAPIAGKEHAAVDLDRLAAGDGLCLQHVTSGHLVDLLVEPVGKGRVLLARRASPYHRLHRSQQSRGLLSWKPTAGSAAAAWAIDCTPGDGGLRIRASNAPDCLRLDASGSFGLCDGGCDESLWQLAAPTAAAPRAPPPSAPSFADDGFLLLPGLVPPAKLQRALRFLNHHLGAADLAADLEPEGLGVAFARATAAGGAEEAAAASAVVKLGGGRRCHCSLAQAAPLLELLGAPQRRQIRAALGSAVRGGELSPMFGCQVALRFPLAPFAEGVLDGEAALAPLMLAAADWHTDKAKYNEKKSFDLVVGVFLSAVASAADGALFVLPGSHRAERARREAGRLARGGAPGRRSCAPAPPPFSAARPILAAPGDAIVFDGDLLHAGGPCLAPAVRYALYFRMRLERRGGAAQDGDVSSAG